ncbi:MAG TPA: acetyl-CoA carboxylase carboxyltransferase subunit alpha [bacterium (Candidatus Stahlbacteria)]|nr:acetyl-CoA carboxylase carboxyltransferase subunit alpha [Candidatus Stahlbacteria bacterium]
MNRAYLDFERPIIELERKIEELKLIADEGNIEINEEIRNLEEKAKKLRHEIFSNLTPWQKVQLARHPARPYTSDYVKYMLDDFIELHGDRYFGDDPALIAGIGKLEGRSIILIGQEKGRTTKEKLRRNFGMMHPEGYRKALRVMRLGAKFNKPIVSLIDTAGAYPGIGAEERGQAEAIAYNMREISVLPVPIIVIITGEGGSGGALGIGIGDKVFMMEYAFYSVISPEGCASILWRDSSKAPYAAEALKLTAQDLLELKVIDGIIKEPEGGAHRDHKKAAENVKQTILSTLDELFHIPGDELVRRRIDKFANMGKIGNIESPK